MWKYRIFLEAQSDINLSHTDLRIFARGLHRTVINWFNIQDTELTSKIKENNTLRPFNISFLRFDNDKKLYFFEICIINEKLGLNKLLEDSISNSVKDEEIIDLNYSKFKVNSWNLLISKNYFELIEIVSKKKDFKPIKIDFISETCFVKKYQHNSKATFPLPDPELFFESVVNRWNTFSLSKFSIDEVIEYVKQNVFISHVNIKSDTFCIGYAKERPIFITGFKGSIILEQVLKDPSWDSILKTLSLYSSWSSVGKKSAFGLGQTRVNLF
ncbi:MAG: CRISPR system precrRNA processing endoribonuclease RAMP protein Cas6 [Candidatus Sericytochromatia bacterium]